MAKKLKSADELQYDSRLYATYCNKYCLTAQAYGSSIATTLFVSMLNPEYRGNEFNWSKLEGMATSLAECNVFTGFSPRIWNRYASLIIEDAVKSARYRVQELLRESDVESWLPLN